MELLPCVMESSWCRCVVRHSLKSFCKVPVVWHCISCCHVLHAPCPANTSFVGTTTLLPALLTPLVGTTMLQPALLTPTSSLIRCHLPACRPPPFPSPGKHLEGQLPHGPGDVVPALLGWRLAGHTGTRGEAVVAGEGNATRWNQGGSGR